MAAQTDIEPGILSLVEALNKTGLVRTFSSCEGHFDPKDQTLRDRNHAEVRFVPADGVAVETVESWLGGLLNRFKTRHGLMPVTVVGYKLFTPVGEDDIDETFVLELRPFNRFDPPATKRQDVNRAVEQASLVCSG
ncbi:hypothetical protein J2I47_10760 [Fibrella sp. HMF5335]|uniref:Uncharacterized protein n=1 Tax=Fibrella rubiginis TaxID=2817060 RepID=A0A939GGF8_9BACT|nr:hypothetical protein [Fibrella rubiginis]MBO0937025.1 hypothetical protein [Fibrella rubiginis]